MDVVDKAIGVSLEKIGVHEAAELSVVCREIYAQHYLHLWFDAGEWYQQTRYNAATLATELAEPNAEFYWVLLESQKVGYLKIVLHATPPELPGYTANKALEVERIYLDQKVTGMGVGRYVMDWVDRAAQRLKKHYVFLYSMDSSEAVKFYEKVGYQKAATKRLPFEQMKPEYRGMYLMIKEL